MRDTTLYIVSLLLEDTTVTNKFAGRATGARREANTAEVNGAVHALLPHPRPTPTPHIPPRCASHFLKFFSGVLAHRLLWRMAPATPSGVKPASPPRDATTYGSFLFPTPPAAATSSYTPEVARREANLAQREREVSERERQLVERRRFMLGCDLAPLRSIGTPIWRDAPPHWQLLCRRLWQLWAATAMLFAWNWLGEVGFSLIAGGRQLRPGCRRVQECVVAGVIASSMRSAD